MLVKVDFMSTVSIGQAAKLFRLAPSTLRWWERQGVFGADRSSAGRRRYGEDELRRIGMVYLCHMMGRMPLDLTAGVTAGPSDVGTWQHAVRDHVKELSRQIDELTAAREYLNHLLRCGGDDPADCPHLDGELQQHTPRGRFDEKSLVDSAQRAGNPDSPGPA